jgi:hypothetical protein
LHGPYRYTSTDTVIVEIAITVIVIFDAVVTADVATGPSRGPDHASGDNISDDCTHRSPKEGMTDDYISDDYISDDFISD